MPASYLDRGPVEVPTINRRPIDVAAPAIEGATDLTNALLEVQKKQLDAERQVKVAQAEDKLSAAQAQVLDDAAKLPDSAQIPGFINQGMQQAQRDVLGNERDPAVARHVQIMGGHYAQDAANRGVVLRSQKIAKNTAETIALREQKANEVAAAGDFDGAVQMADEAARLGIGPLYDEKGAELRMQQSKRTLALEHAQGLLNAGQYARVDEFVAGGNGLDAGDVAAIKARSISSLGQRLQAAVASNDIAGLNALAGSLPDDPRYKGMVDSAKVSMQRNVSRTRLGNLLGAVGANEISAEKARDVILSGIARGQKDPSDPMAFDGFDLATFDGQVDGRLKQRDMMLQAETLYRSGRAMDKKFQPQFDQLVTQEFPAIEARLAAKLGKTPTQDQIDREVILKTIPNGLMPSYIHDAIVNGVTGASTNPQGLRRAAALAAQYRGSLGEIAYREGTTDTQRALLERANERANAGEDWGEIAKSIYDEFDPVKSRGVSKVYEVNESQAIKALTKAFGVGQDKIEAKVLADYLTEFRNQIGRTGTAAAAQALALETMKARVGVSTVLTDQPGTLTKQPIDQFARPSWAPGEIETEFANHLIDAVSRGRALTLPDGVKAPDVSSDKFFATHAALGDITGEKAQRGEMIPWIRQNVTLVPDPLLTVEDGGQKRPLYRVMVLDKFKNPHPLLVDGKPMAFDASYDRSQKRRDDDKANEELQNKATTYNRLLNMGMDAYLKQQGVGMN